MRTPLPALTSRCRRALQHLDARCRIVCSLAGGSALPFATATSPALTPHAIRDCQAGSTLTRSGWTRRCAAHCARPRRRPQRRAAASSPRRRVREPTYRRAHLASVPAERRCGACARSVPILRAERAGEERGVDVRAERAAVSVGWDVVALNFDLFGALEGYTGHTVSRRSASNDTWSVGRGCLRTLACAAKCPHDLAQLVCRRQATRERTTLLPNSFIWPPAKC